MQWALFIGPHVLVCRYLVVEEQWFVEHSAFCSYAVAIKHRNINTLVVSYCSVCSRNAGLSLICVHFALTCKLWFELTECRGVSMEWTGVDARGCSWNRCKSDKFSEMKGEDRWGTKIAACLRSFRSCRLLACWSLELPTTLPYHTPRSCTVNGKWRPLP